MFEDAALAAADASRINLPPCLSQFTPTRTRRRHTSFKGYPKRRSPAISLIDHGLQVALPIRNMKFVVTGQGETLVTMPKHIG